MDSRGLQSKWRLKHWVNFIIIITILKIASNFQHCFFVCNLGSERESSIEAVINWLLENPDMSASEAIESDGREAAAVEGIFKTLIVRLSFIIKFFIFFMNQDQRQLLYNRYLHTCLSLTLPAATTTLLIFAII